MELAVGFLILLSMVFIIAMVIFIVFDIESLVNLFYWLAILTLMIGMVILIVSFVFNVLTGKWVV